MYKQTSKVQSLAGEAIRFWFKDESVLENYRPSWLYGMELDFYIPRLMIGFEIQGEQHTRYVQKFHRSNEGFRKQQERDCKKRELCMTNHVVLVEVFSILELTRKARSLIRGRRLDNLPADLQWRMKEYQEANDFINQNEWVVKDINRKKKNKKKKLPGATK